MVEAIRSFYSAHYCCTRGCARPTVNDAGRFSERALAVIDLLSSADPLHSFCMERINNLSYRMSISVDMHPHT